MLRHYAPHIPLRLNALDPQEDEAFLAFGESPPLGAKITLNLSPQSNLMEAAANLFYMLRKADSPDYKGIAVMPIPETDLGLAINDRLKRAAHK